MVRGVNAVAQARREAARVRRERFRERFRRVEKHVVAVGEIQAEADALVVGAGEDAERLRVRAAAVELDAERRAGEKREEIVPHLVALLRLGQSLGDVAELCEVPLALVRAARRTMAADREADAEPRPLVPGSRDGGTAVMAGDSAGDGGSAEVDGGGEVTGSVSSLGAGVGQEAARELVGLGREESGVEGVSLQGDVES